MDTAFVIADLDPEEREDIERLIARAVEEDCYLHIELRKREEAVA